MESQETKYPVFWLINQSQRIALCQFQWERYKTKLDIANSKAPWEEKPPVPKISVRVDEEELAWMMKLPPLKGRGY